MQSQHNADTALAQTAYRLPAPYLQKRRRALGVTFHKQTNTTQHLIHSQTACNRTRNTP